VILRARQDSGFSAVELLIVLAILGGMAAIGIPLSNGMIDDFKSRGDAQGLSAAIAQTKLTSASKFTRARLYVNLSANSYRIQTWTKTGTPGWTAATDEIFLSDRSTFGFGSVAAPPANTLASLTQAPACLDDVGVTIPGTSCMIFGSRGTPMTAAGLPASSQGVFLHGNSGTFAVIMGAAGQLQVWRTTQTGASTWRQQ
jgi:prepilin-type N-terminal cleavage/methylation domain-containing protein